jgi:subtilase family serine protease
MALRSRTGGLSAFVLAIALLAPAAASARLVRVGPRLPVPAAAVATGRPSAVARLHVTVTLRPRDSAALAVYAREVSTPGSALYRRYLRPAQFARRFGATQAEIKTVTRALRSRGLRPDAPSAGGLSISVTATAAALEHAFAVSLSTLTLPRRGAVVMTPDARPAVPAAAAGAVQSVLGLDTLDAPQPLLVRATASQRRPARRAAAPWGSHESERPHAVGGAPVACPAAQSAAGGQSAYTENQIASAYGFSGVYAAGDEGAGVTAAVYELEPNDPADIAAYQSCYATNASVSYVPVDGGAGSGAGSGEAALDIENLIGLAPDVHVLVYQGPNSDSNAPGSGPYDTFSAIVNQDRAQVLSVSWGQCEPTVTQADAIAENTLFQQATVQGQTVVSADGDNGAQDCYSPGGPPDLQSAVDDPASQPFVTGVGGTTLTAPGPRPTETVWNSGATLLGLAEDAGASGGGVSSFWAMPPAQSDAAGALGVPAAADGQSPCGSASGACREVPDVAADADPATGYLIYWNGSGSVPGQPAGWQGIGGTSAAAPLWAALIALADASPGCANSPVGYADPALYRAAGTSYASDFNDITTGNNDFTGTNGGHFAAKVGYDAVTGLGSPNADALIGAMCDRSVRLSTPASQQSTERTSVSLQLHASDVAGQPIYYTASGLPPGLALSESSGKISGQPTRTGTYTVQVYATDGTGSTSTSSFVWVIGGPPRVSRLRWQTGHGAGSRLAFTVTVGRAAPELRLLTITLPRQLRLVTSRRGITIRPSGLRVTSRLSGKRTLLITLAPPVSTLSIVLSSATLQLSGKLPAMNAPLRSRPLLTIGVTDIDLGRSVLSARLSRSRS